MWDLESQADDDNATVKVHFLSHMYITQVIAHLKKTHTHSVSFFRSFDCTGGTYSSA